MNQQYYSDERKESFFKGREYRLSRLTSEVKHWTMMDYPAIGSCCYLPEKCESDFSLTQIQEKSLH